MHRPDSWRLRRYLFAEWRRLGVAGFAMAARAAVLVAVPWPLKYVVNCVILGKAAPHWLNAMIGMPAPTRFALLNVLGGAMVLLALLDAGLDFAGNRLVLEAGQRTIYVLRQDLFSHMIRLPSAFHRKRRGGELMSRLSEDVGRVQDIVTVAGTGLLPHLLTLSGIIGVMLTLDWHYALLAMASLPGLAFVSNRWAGLLRARLREVRGQDGELWGMAQEVLAVLPLVQACGWEAQESQAFGAMAARSLRAGLAASRRQAQLAPLINLLISCGAAAITWYGALRVADGTLTAGDLLLFLAYLRGMVTPARQIAKAAPLLGRASVALERIREMFAEPLTVTDAPGLSAPAQCTGKLEFRGVSFAYTPGHPVLSDVGFCLEPGRMVALVGPTGAGKSTIAALAIRLMDPSDGQILLDGEDLRRLPVAFVRGNVALMLQESQLLHRTVWENIAYGQVGATRADAIRAAIAAGVDEVIRGLPGSYDYIVAEHGASLSGGQRQCIAIARATLAQARVVILDEPSSSLDASTERRTSAALDRLIASRATLVIAHRLATIRKADLILVVEGGRVVQRGTHRELRDQGGLYGRLLRAQEYESTALSAVAGG